MEQLDDADALVENYISNMTDSERTTLVLRDSDFARRVGLIVPDGFINRAV